MFYALFLGMVGWTYSLCQKLGPRAGLWHGWMFAIMLLPVWFMAGILSITFDLRGGVALTALVAMLMSPPSREELNGFRQRILVSDVLVIVIIIGQIATQYVTDDLRPMTSFEILRKWLIPYLVGRMFLLSPKDIARAVPAFCLPALVMSVLAVIEGLAKVNLVNMVLGKTYGLLEQGEGYRMGMKRAQGPMDHPIFFGMMLVMLMPWAIEAARQAKQPGGKGWWRCLPWMVGFALFCTVSRGPQAAAIIMAIVAMFLLKPNWRIILIILVLAGGGMAYKGKDVVMDVMGKVAGEEEEKKILTINGEECEYSGTAHRMLLWKVYAEYIRTAGYFGFGAKLKGVVIEDERIAELFASIDNGYLLLYLQYGSVGVFGFIGLVVCNIYYLGRVGSRGRADAVLAACLCGALLGISITMMSVWFAPDYAAIWCFSSGIAANLRLIYLTPVLLEESRNRFSSTIPENLVPEQSFRHLAFGCPPVVRNCEI